MKFKSQDIGLKTLRIALALNVCVDSILPMGSNDSANSDSVEGTAYKQTQA